MPPLNTASVRVGQPRGPRRQPKRHSYRRYVRIAFTLSVAIALAGSGWLIWRSGRIATALDGLDSRLAALSAKAGFRVEQVEVIGRNQTGKQALLDAVGLKRGDPILAFSPEETRQRVEALPWVASAAIERRLPDVVAVTIVERHPIALWQHGGRLSLIDAAGADLGSSDVDGAPSLPLVVGPDASPHAAELLALLGQHSEIAHRVQASVWIGSRRWDLKLDNGVDVLLPETGVAEALQQLADSQASSHLLERDIATVDLRLAGKLVVRLAHEPAAPAKSKSREGI